MKAYQLSFAAQQDLEEIATYIASERPSAVDVVLQAIESACAFVAAYPSVGRLREELDEGVLSFPVGAYVLFYYHDDDVVGIARKIHARRDVRTAFDQV